jgi:hypothetical protein
LHIAIPIGSIHPIKTLFLSYSMPKEMKTKEEKKTAVKETPTKKTVTPSKATPPK